MSLVWNKLLGLAEELESVLAANSQKIYEKGMDRFNQPGWVNRVYANDDYRRAHIDIVDARESKGLWMMHCCIFPQVNNTSPIFGYDVIAGKEKITGFFHDFSPVCCEDHPMSKHFKETTNTLTWKKERQLPDWALQIFSKDMIAAGNIKAVDEKDFRNMDIMIKNLKYYIENVGKYKSNFDFTQTHNKYSHYQKQNPHTPKAMAALGLNKEDVEIFIKDCLFPEINR